MSDGRNPFSVLGAMAATRLELAAIDFEIHVRETAISLLSAFVAIVLGIVALTFAGVAIIAAFWDTHRIVAAAAATAAYVIIAVLVGMSARSRWNSRPPAFAATLREIQLDREAMSGHS